MDQDLRFSETQKFDQWWLRLILLLVNALIAFGTYRQLVLHIPFGDHPMSNTLLIGSLLLMLLVTGLILSSRLETQIKEDGVSVRFYPFQLQFRSYKWNQMAGHAVVVYKPLRDYGGWGFRMSRAGTALSTSGNQGLQLVFHDGRRLLIGTRDADAMKAVLNDISR